MSKDPTELLTVNEHCREKKISPTTFYRLKKLGFIPDDLQKAFATYEWAHDYAVDRSRETGFPIRDEVKPAAG